MLEEAQNMIPEPVLYAAYVVLIGIGVAFCTALVAGTYLIWEGIRAFRKLREGKPSMKEFMNA